MWKDDSSSKNNNYWTTFIISFISSAIAELVALTFYYPFDLIKTRMQIISDHHIYKYNGVLDAFIKISQE